MTNLLEGILASDASVTSDSLANDLVAHFPKATSLAREYLGKGRPTEFDRELSMPLTRLIRALIREEIGNGPGAQERARSAELLFQNAGFYRRHLRQAFKRFEGSSCCADKAATVLHAIARHLVADEPILFDVRAKFTYNLPETILNTQEEVLAYFNAITSLLYGDFIPAMRQYVAWARAVEMPLPDH